MTERIHSDSDTGNGDNLNGDNLSLESNLKDKGVCNHISWDAYTI